MTRMTTCQGMLTVQLLEQMIIMSNNEFTEKEDLSEEKMFEDDEFLDDDAQAESGFSYD